MKELEYPIDSAYILSKKKSIRRRLLQEIEEKAIHIKVALLGGSTTSEIKDCLELFLLNEGIKPDFYESAYGRFYEEALFDNRALDTFNPDIVYIHTSNRNICEWPKISDSIEDVELKLQETYDKFEQIWDSIFLKYNCIIIQNNMEMPFYRLMGNIEASDYRGKINFITKVNMRFNDYANRHENFYINDINYISAYYGLEKWEDPFAWYMFKYCLSVEAIPVLSRNISLIIKSLYGKNKKAMVLDLDNTLWGGVIAEEGKDNIEIGQETSVGQAYCEFQTFIKKHKDLGILLNISSKNDENIAMEGLKLKDSVLTKEDFIIVKTNWEPKSINITEIIRELGIMPDSIVFIDDNPAERELVAGQIPQVCVPELSRVENYIKEISENGYFEVTRFSDDDQKRTAMYQANEKRKQAVSKYKEYQDYLKSLKMVATILPFSKAEISRIVQLANKSNQFNLTTRRYTQKEIEEIIDNPNYITLYGRLKDKFGDNGIVSLVIGRMDDSVLHIELWLMSCRVLKRDMEKAMLDAVIASSTENNINEIRGYYYPTEKNHMVEKFYEACGFSKIAEDEAGNTKWKLCLDGSCRLMNQVIEVEKRVYGKRDNL